MVRMFSEWALQTVPMFRVTLLIFNILISVVTIVAAQSVFASTISVCFALAYQRSIEGISFTMSEAWRKFNSPQVPEKQKPAYLRLIKDCHESMMQLVINGPAVTAVENLRKRIERAGINVDFGPNVDQTLTDKYRSHDSNSIIK
jgi:hypothetical protein